ncbi:GTP-binding protein [Mycena pura]|uniref:GTP-binding protein n=1 Tax=Mycena pura TaxID=153505 RepID=A0AAD6VH64_9AGAR|nr:GTP-binding protein [Mycena pura]
MDKAIELRSKCKHFRVLVIGRANAGKTTLLKKVCNSIEDPEIFSPEGEKVLSRGLHDIENQLIFKSNPQFVFHDSRGFESGSVEEMENVKTFIAKQAGGNNLSEQLHAIWRPMKNFSTLMLPAKASLRYCLYPTNQSYQVPVIAIFTKFDGLVNEAYTELIDSELELSHEGAEKKQLEKAQELLDNRYREPLRRARYPPSDNVQVDDMRVDDSNCNELIAKTAEALTDDTLRLLFVSVQQNNIDLCIEYALKE